MGDLYERIVKIVRSLERTATLHFSVGEDTRTACNKKRKDLIVERVDFERPRRRNGRLDYSYGSYDFFRMLESKRFYLRWTYNKDYEELKNKPPLMLCPGCREGVKRKFGDYALASLKATTEAPIPAPTAAPIEDPQQKRLREAGLLPPPTRPIGTEEMTGHWDEGSQGGGCGEGYGGFKTNFMPWITCSRCLVVLDGYQDDGWFADEGPLAMRGLYIEDNRSPSKAPEQKKEIVLSKEIEQWLKQQEHAP